MKKIVKAAKKHKEVICLTMVLPLPCIVIGIGSVYGHSIMFELLGWMGGASAVTVSGVLVNKHIIQPRKKLAVAKRLKFKCKKSHKNQGSRFALTAKVSYGRVTPEVIYAIKAAQSQKTKEKGKTYEDKQRDKREAKAALDRIGDPKSIIVTDVFDESGRRKKSFPHLKKKL